MDKEDVQIFGKVFVALNKIENCKEFADFIPEVRTNLVYTKENAKTPDDVVAIDGRITKINNVAKAAGMPKYGASSHMARLILELQKFDQSIRAGINFRNDPPLAKWLKEYCKSKGWVFSIIDRSKEPEELKDEEKASMPWKVAEAVRNAGNKPPKIFYETGAVGKEPVTVLVGKDPIEVAEQACEIARLYSSINLPKASKRV
jgi:hydroxymethylpyrimidine/phosphomethylpyrimidine kinase